MRSVTRWEQVIRKSIIGEMNSSTVKVSVEHAAAETIVIPTRQCVAADIQCKMLAAAGCLRPAHITTRKHF
jgi:hypothetical protein